MIIAIEGIDGCGKTSVIKELVNKKNDLNYSSFLAKFPTRPGAYSLAPSWVQYRILGYLQGVTKIETKLDALRFQWLHSIDKSAHAGLVEEAKKFKSFNYLMDRYTLSTHVYGVIDLMSFGVPSGEAIEMVKAFYIELPNPNLHIILGTSPEIAVERMKTRYMQEAYEGIEKLKLADNIYRLSVEDFAYDNIVLIETDDLKIHQVADKVRDVVEQYKISLEVDENAKS